MKKLIICLIILLSCESFGNILRRYDNDPRFIQDSNGDLSITAPGGDISFGDANLSDIGTISLGTNTILDGNFNGNWAFNGGNLSGIGTITSTGAIEGVFDINQPDISDTALGYLGGGGFRRGISHNWIPSYLQNMSTAADWTTSGGTDAKDTTFYRSGTGSIKFTPDGSGTEMTSDVTFASIDLSNTHIVVKFYIHEGSGNTSYTNLERIRLLVWGPTAGSFIDNFVVWTNGSYEANPHFGWDYATLVQSDVGQLTNGGADYTDVDRLRIELKYTNNTAPEVSIDTIEFYPDNTFSPKVMFRFDDGIATQYDAGGYLASNGMVATYGIIGSAVGSGNILTLAQLRDLQVQGHLIANHGWTTDKWDDMTAVEIRDNLTLNAEWMCKNGFTQGARIIISPGGRWPQHAKPVLDELTDFVWLVIGARNLARVDTFYAPNIQRIIVETVDSGATPTNAKASVDDAIADNGIMTMMYHGVTAGDVTTKFQAFVDYVATKRDAGDIEVITPTDLLGLKSDFWRDVPDGIAYNQGTVGIGGAFNYAIDTAANDTYVATVQGITAYNAGLVIWLNPVTDNTGACTLNINSLGAKSLKTVLAADPGDSHIDAAQIVPLVYDGTNFVILTPDSNP